MAALPQPAQIDEDEPSMDRPLVSVFRVRPPARRAGYYRNRPLIQLRCPAPPELPPRPSDPPQIRLVAPIPGLDELDWYDEDGVAEDAPVAETVFDEENAFYDEDEDAVYDGDGVYDDDRGHAGGPVAVQAEPFDDESTEDDDRFDDDLAAADDELPVAEVDDPADDDDLADDGEQFDDDLSDDEITEKRPHRAVQAEPARVLSPAHRHAAVEPKSRRETAEPGRGPLPLLVAALVLAVLVVLGLVGVVVREHQSSASGPGAPTSSPTATLEPAETSQASAWVKANLPSETSLVTDGATRNQLIGMGFPASAVTDLSDGPGQARYAVITPAIRAAGTEPGSAIAALLAEALPVAVFGDGEQRVEVSQLGAMSTSLTTAQQARLMAGRSLQRNPGLHIVTGLAGAVSDGRVDMRAETLLAVLANQVPVALLTLPQASVEARAGAPIRTIGIRLTGDPAAGDKLLGSIVHALPPEMAPYQTSQQPDGSFRLVWLPDLALTPPVN